MLQNYIQEFNTYLQIEKNASHYTIEYYLDDLQEFSLFLEEEGINALQDVDQQVARLFLTRLYKEQLSRRTVSRKISSLRSFYRFAERENIVDHNPFVQVSLPKTDKPIPGFLYKEELEKMFAANDLNSPLGQRDQALLELLYATGIRVSECQQLRLRDIDFSIGTVLVMGKGSKQRYVPFGSFAQQALERYIESGRTALLAKSNQASEFIFLNARGAPLTVRGIRKVLDKIVERAALTIHVHPHKLRHTFATHMLNEGADMRTVQEMLGHENLSSTQIYTHVTKDYLRKVYMNSHPRARK